MRSSALEGGVVFGDKGPVAIRVSRGAIQQTAPELFAEFGELAILLFQDAEEVLHRAATEPDVADLLGDGILFGLSILELLAEGIKAPVVLGMILHNCSVLADHLLDHAIQLLHFLEERSLLGFQFRSVEALCHALFIGGNGGVPSSQLLICSHHEM